MAGHVDGIGQAHIAGCQHHVGQGVDEGAAGEGANRARGPAGDGKVDSRQVADVAHQRAGVGKIAQAAGGRDVDRRRGRQTAAVAQRGVGAADVVVAAHEQQGAAAEGAAARQAREGGDHGGAVAGPVGAGHQGAQRARQIVAGGGQGGQDRAAGDVGDAAGRQAVVYRDAQGADRLAVAAGDADGAGQLKVGAVVDQGVAADDDVVVQQDVATRQYHIAAGDGDGAPVGHGGATEGTRHRAGAAGDGQGAGRGLDVAQDGAAIVQQVRLAGEGQGVGATDQAAVQDGAEGTI
ncbi:hypothetical protein AZA_47578 [Nitrospirillum viridazoti Y2]|nr:hypothetical protein AZA_47578 [Nitrospirillum amazonense Y2]